MIRAFQLDFGTRQVPVADRFPFGSWNWNNAIDLEHWSIMDKVPVAAGDFLERIRCVPG